MVLGRCAGMEESGRALLDTPPCRDLGLEVDGERLGRGEDGALILRSCAGVEESGLGYELRVSSCELKAGGFGVGVTPGGWVSLMRVAVDLRECVEGCVEWVVGLVCWG